MARTSECLERAAKARSRRDRQEFLDEVVELNMPVARSVAQRYRRRGISDEDLEQVAYLALVRAAAQFDPAFDRDFLSYAVPTIRGELRKHFRDAGWTVRPPRRVQELQQRIAGVRAALEQELCRSPRPSELAAHLDEDVDDIIEALSTDGCFTPASLDRPLLDTGGGETGSTLGDSLGDDEEGHDGFDAAEARVVLAPLVRRLSERDRRILDLRFFHDATQQQIADEIGVTQMHVSRLLSRILGELRHELDEPAPVEAAATAD
jgi:RNA polymerase sigma-B factor